MLDRERILGKIDELDTYLLVHEYATVDDEIVFGALKTKLEDFRKFKEEVLKALSAQ